MYSSTCFGRLHAHHQELINCSSSLWFYRWSVVVAVLLVAVGPAGLTTTNSTAIIVFKFVTLLLLYSFCNANNVYTRLSDLLQHTGEGTCAFCKLSLASLSKLKLIKQYSMCDSFWPRALEDHHRLWFYEGLVQHRRDIHTKSHSETLEKIIW